MLKVLYPVTEIPEEAAGKKSGIKKIDLTDKLFTEYGVKYADRKGGYTRIVKIGQRKGDGALEVILELV
jgi:large subunit ribosomal protein L17